MSTDADTIMIVDDDPDIRDLMKIFLEADGYHVHLAADGTDALEQLHAGVHPSLILLDLMMPRMDGEQFMKEIRGTRFSKIPIVVISGHSTVRKKTREFEAAAFLMKPVEFNELLKTVRRFVPVRPSNEAA
jgi:DNA-binding response OmpR family regulator